MSGPLPYASHTFSTRALHTGSEPSLSSSSAVIPDISLSTTYHQSSVGIHKGYEYSRSSNPTRLALERALAGLEGGDVLLRDALISEGYSLDGEEGGKVWEGGPAAVAVSSGSAATATVVSGLVGVNGHIVCVGDVYGGTSRYMLKVAGVQQGAETTFVDMSYGGRGEEVVDGEEGEVMREREDDEILSRVRKSIKPNTKLIWAESPTNPLLNLVPIGLLSTLAKEFKIPLVIDNTFASPYYQNPLALGADVVVASVTKYINGHSDVILGLIITPRPTLLSQFRFSQNAHGAVPSPFDCWLVLRSLKTLALRMREHGTTALLAAKFLDGEAREKGWVRGVRYPGLNRGDRETRGERRERELAWDGMAGEAKEWVESQGYTRDGEGGFPFSGIVSFYIHSPHPSHQAETNTAERFLEGLKIFALAESLGGVESLAELPILMTHAGVDAGRRKELGIDGELIRLSLGVEGWKDLKADLEGAFKASVVVNGK